MDKISVGKLRYLYGLTCEVAHQMAGTLGAICNSEVLCAYKGKPYSEDQFDAIVADLSTKGNSLPNKFPLISYNSDDSRSRSLLYPDEGLFHWAVCTSEIDVLIIEGRKESLGTEYKSPPYKDLKPNYCFWQQKPLESLNLALLDTAVVDAQKAVNWLKSKSYAPPSRQVFERHPYLEFTWEEFQEMLELSRCAPSRKGGSWTYSENIKATSDMCERIRNDYLAGNPPLKNLSFGSFDEMVKEAMGSTDQSNLYHQDAVRTFFRESQALAQYKRKRGRPSTKAQNK